MLKIKQRAFAMVLVVIMATIALVGCSNKQSPQTTVAENRQLADVVMDFTIIASADWSGREEEGKMILADTLKADQAVIDVVAEVATTAKPGSPEETQYRALLWSIAQAQRATSTRGERVTKDVSEGIDKAFDVLDQGKEALDQVLNGTSKGGGGN